MKLFLSRLGPQRPVGGESRRSIVIIDYAINLEHVGDIIEKGLCEQVRKKIGNGLYFSDEGFEELKSLFALTIDNLRIAQTIFVTRDTALARQLMEIKVEIRRREKSSSQQHLRRLRDGRVESLQTSSLHLDMLRDLKRVNAHLVSVAHPFWMKAAYSPKAAARAGRMRRPRSHSSKITKRFCVRNCVKKRREGGSRFEEGRTRSSPRWWPTATGRCG